MGLATGLLRSFSCDRPLVSSPPLPKSTHCTLISHLRADWEEWGGGQGGGGAEGGNEWGRDGKRSGEVMVLDTEEKGRTGSKEVTGGQMRKAGRKNKSEGRKDCSCGRAVEEETGFDFIAVAQSAIQPLQPLICSNVRREGLQM